MTNKSERFYNIVALASMALIILPVGIACLILGFGLGDNPCILCWQERAILIFVTLTTLFIMRYGLRPKYLGLLILYCTIGIFMTLRHTGGHFLRDLGQGFSLEIFGLHTYTWGVVICWSILLILSIILIFFGNNLVDNEDGEVRYLSKFQSLAFISYFIILFFNSVQAFTQVGPPPFIGHSDPVRFSWVPKNWHWSTKNWSGLLKPFSLRGNYSIDKPYFKHDERRKIAMFQSGDELMKVKEVSLPSEIRGGIRDIDYNSESKLFAIVTDQYFIYILDDKLKSILYYVRIDPLYSIDIKTFVGISFIGPRRLMVTGYNKSYVVIRIDEGAKIVDHYAGFLEGTNGISEKYRGRLSSVRSKYSYIRCLAYDKKTQELVIVSIPNEKNNKVIATRFSSADFLLNSEKEIFIDDNDLGPVISSLKVIDSILYGLDPNSSEILILDNELDAFSGSIKLPKGNYHGLAVFEGKQFVLIEQKRATFYTK
ncbi:disulfide bond formation protein B [Halobacteriovorax sp. DA5]|uniref:disulfide bond formation protein B n=1 Tax=Halobacteriovorax sp. DA5 TaxID=2067553 RepID=UPI000CD2E836|nr:disulfide bond formation protein B [Halobacteriovorax sp. DA5]POB13380.1 disulfide bond formation protein B [Halobacteriovorax sp. DA5]